MCEGSPGFRKILVAQNPHQDPAISDRVLATLAEPTRLAAGFGPRVTLDIPVIHPVDGSPAPDALCLDSAWPNFRSTNSKYNDSRIKLVRPLVLFLPLSENLNLPPPIFLKDHPKKVPPLAAQTLQRLKNPVGKGRDLGWGSGLTSPEPHHPTLRILCNMKLSEALALRADLNKRIADVTNRMVANAIVQEGTKPGEDANELLEQAEQMAAQLQYLIARINHTNLATIMEDGRTLTDAIAERDVLLVRISMHRRLADAAHIKQTVQTRSEVRFVPLVDITALRKKLDELSARHRKLDVQIQGVNWTTDLIEN